MTDSDASKQGYLLVRAPRGKKIHVIGTASGDDRPLCRARKPKGGWFTPPAPAKLNCRACLLEIE